MHDFTAHRLRFVAQVETPMSLDPYVGTGLRAAFFNALTGQFCMNPLALHNGGCGGCPLGLSCPVAYLVATLDPEADRGENVPRPLTIEPPLWRTEAGEEEAEGRYARRKAEGGPEAVGSPERRVERWASVLHPPAVFEFGLTMFARALSLFPYVVLSLERMERQGLGHRLAVNRGRRGEFRVREVVAENPVTGERQAVLRAGHNRVTLPDVPVTHEQISALPVPPPGSRVRVAFLTPTRLMDQKTLVRRAPAFRVLFQRLMERLVALSAAFGEWPLDHDLKYEAVGLSDAVRLVADRTRWVHMESPSSRQRGVTSISGLVGYAVYAAADWAPFWPWLKWGELTHVGKNTVKGEGMVRVLSDER